MRSLLIIILSLFLFGCEIYEEPSNPQLNINGNWKIVDIIVTYSENLSIINDNFYAISPFIVVSVTNDNWLLRNDTTNIQPCYFYKKGYIWEFDYNLLLLKNNNGELLNQYYVGFINSYYNPNYFKLTEKTTNMPIGGIWTFEPKYGNGSFPSSVLYITVPEIEFSIDGPERSYDRMISQNITLLLMR